jgi:hypothetical protein
MNYMNKLIWPRFGSVLIIKAYELLRRLLYLFFLVLNLSSVNVVFLYLIVMFHHVLYITVAS